MAKTINTRIRLKYDNFNNWTSNNPILLAGEIAVVVVPAEQNEGLQTQKPAVLFKVGDGTNHFNDLPWSSALAGDVYAWAKAATKPSYTHSEVGAAAATHTHVAADITDFTSAVQALIPEATVDTNTTYKIVANGANSFKLQSKDIDGDWTDAYTFTVDFAAVNAAIAAKYTKPEGGIPLTDLAESVQGSIGQAHTHANKAELDKIQSGDKAKWDAKYSKPAGGIGSTDLASDVVASLGKADTALQEVADGSITNAKLDSSLQGKVAQAHSHANKDELDKIASGKVATWDGAVSAVANKVEKVVGTVDNFVAFGAEGAIKDSGKKASDFEVAGTADSKVQAHNVAGNAHSDIRALITALQETVSGLGNALHFVGAGNTASRPASGKNGDVYVDTEKGVEYVWSGDSWEEFGNPEHLTKATADGYYDAKGTAQGLVNNAKSELNGKIEAVDTKADSNTAEVTKIKNGTTVVPKATDATNVTTNINGKAISNIFEPDGLKIKKATLADTATNANHATNADNATEATHAASATNANTAANATKLGGKAADTYLNTADEIIFDCGNSVISVD